MQNDNLIGNVRIGGGGPSCHMIGEKRRLQVENVGSVDIDFRGFADVCLTLTNWCFVHAACRPIF